MSTPFHTKVSLRGFHFEDAHLTVVLAAGITKADIGKAMTVDATAANKFKLAADNSPIVARLETVEDRVNEGQLIGTISFRFANYLPIKTGATIAVGDTAVGAGAGEVKRLESGGNSTPDYSINYVAEIVGTNAVVVKI